MNAPTSAARNIMDQFNLLARAIAHAVCGSFYHFDTYSALTTCVCFIRAYNIGGRLAIVATIHKETTTNVIEMDQNRCVTIMWRILFRIDGYNEALCALLPQPIAEEISEHIIVPVNIIQEEFGRD